MLRALRNRKNGVSPVVAMIILVAITVIIASLLYIWVTNTMQSGGMMRDSVPTVVFDLKNSNAALSANQGDENVAVITISEGQVLNSELEVLVSADGDSFTSLTTITQVPDNEPFEYWDAGEAIIVTEDPSLFEDADVVLDANGDWQSADVYIRVVHTPTEKVVYTSHITIEEGYYTA